MSELEKQVREIITNYPDKETWWQADVVGCSERTVQRVKQKIREEKEKNERHYEPPPKKINLNLSPLPKPDMINSPPHYTTGGIEVIDYIQAKLTHEEFRGYLLGNSLKYLSRVGKKGAVTEDLGKAAWYVKKLSEIA